MLLIAGAMLYCSPAPAAAQSTTGPAASVEQRQVGGDRSSDSGESMLGPWVQMILALAVVVALIFGLQWLLKRIGGRRAGGSRSGVLDVVARTGVTTRQELMLVRLGERMVLLGRSATGITRLAEIDDANEVQRLQALIEGRDEKTSGEGGQP